MPTKGWKRTWVKLFVTGWLHGSIRWQLEPDERSVWADLICLAGECGHEGVICDNDGESLPRDFVANQLNIKQTLLDRTIAKSIHDKRLEEVDGRLHIVNWATYQSEYERQKPYRRKPQDKQEPASKSSLDVYLEELRPKYPGLDVNEEWESCQLWWSEQGKEIKSPKLALKNWLNKAGKFKKGKPGVASAKKTTIEELKASTTARLR